MPAEARISSTWSKQKLFVSILFLVFGGWFFKDAIWGYPQSNVRWDKHQQLVEEKRETEWPEYARKQGWIVEPPEKRYDDSAILLQYIIGSVTEVVGVLFLIYWLTQRSRTIRSDEEAVYTPSGTRVPFSTITTINKVKWETKGIARIRYMLEGRQGEFVVDDYKFETEPARQIFQEIEDRSAGKRAAEPQVEPPPEPTVP